LQPEFDKLLGQ